MTNFAIDLAAKFGEVKRQPKGNKSMSQVEKLRKTAPYVLGGILFDDDEKTIAELIPPGVVSDSVANHVGTCWGNGQGGKNGAQLWKLGKKIRRVRENAVIAAGYLSHPQIDEFCEKHSIENDGQALYELIAALPAVDD